MRVIILRPTIMGGVDYQPKPVPQRLPDHIAQHLIEIGNAKPFEDKVEAVAIEKKVVEVDSTVSPAAPVSEPKTARKSRKKKTQPTEL